MTNPYPHIIRLARSGSPGRAWSMMEEHGLLDSDTDQRALTLQARLVKDHAKRAEGGERARLFADAAALYAKAGALDNASYPLINAASLSLLAGKADQSAKLARDVLAALDANPDEAETPYWLGATRAEALLLLGDETGARAALRNAVAKQPAAYEDHAATIGQFELLCSELGFDAAWLNQIRPPKVIRFSGLMHTALAEKAAQDSIAEWLERENIGFGFGAVAAGADIWIAEALMARGAQLHIVLPCELSAFRKHSVTSVDFAWGDRFDRLIAGAADVTVLSVAQMPSAAAVTRGDSVAWGMAQRRAAALRTDIKQLRIAGTQDERGHDTQHDKPSDSVVLTATRVSPKKRAQTIPDDAARFYVATVEGVKVFDAPSDTQLNAMVAMQKAATPVAIDYAITARDASPDFIEQRLQAMLDCAEEGQRLATQEAAFAIYAGNPDLAVEAGGDMRWSGGTMPLYSIG